MRFLSCVLLFGSLASALCQPREISSRFEFSHDIPPRLQWNENNGYCGETSFISAGMHFGQYCSQFTARSIASPGIPQHHPDAQLLLGVNDRSAAKRMRLDAIEFLNRSQRSSREFLAWVKSRTLLGEVVIIGVFNNVTRLEEPPSLADPEYDHIVPVLEIGSQFPFDTRHSLFIPSDVITISDNGLYGPVGEPPVYPYLFAYRMVNFLGTRFQANRPNGPMYLLKNRPKNYGISIRGVLDLDGVTVPVRLSSNTNREPEIAHGSNTPPAPEPIKLFARVTLPDPSVAYNLYRYDDFAKVPVAGFNARAGDAVQSWRIPANSGNIFEVELDVLSNETVIFRAVPETAP